MGVINKKILLLSTGDINGAYESIYKVSYFLQKNDYQVAMLVKNKTRTDAFVYSYSDYQLQIAPVFFRYLSIFVNKVKTKFFTKKNVYDSKYAFISTDETTRNISPKIIIEQIGFVPDFIFTGMTDNFLNSTDLLALQQFTKAQVYNITVDMNHFTGGCHFAWDCDGYIKGCTDKCPAILTSSDRNRAKINFETKLKNAQLGQFKIIAGSGWTLDQARKSLIYKNQGTIFNVNSIIDVDLFTPKNRSFAKKIFNLEEGKFYILMGCQNANETRKGFEYLLMALQILEKNLTLVQKDKIEVLIVSRTIANDFSKIPFAKKHIEYIKDYRLLSLLYQAADVFVNSSIEDSGPMMVSEALACGTPVVGFDMGVVSNMVISNYNGYKAILKDSADLSKGIHTIFSLDLETYEEYSKNAVEQVKTYSSFQYVKNVIDQITVT